MSAPAFSSTTTTKDNPMSAQSWTVTNEGFTRREGGVTAAEFAAMVNDAVVSGAKVEVDGREVWSRWNRTSPAKTWNNGSVSVDVRGRSKGTQGTVWVRASSKATVTVTA